MIEDKSNIKYEIMEKDKFLISRLSKLQNQALTSNVENKKLIDN